MHSCIIICVCVYLRRLLRSLNMQTSLHVQDPVQVQVEKHNSVKLDLIFVRIILAILIGFLTIFSLFRKVKSFFAYLYSFTFVGYLTVYVVLSALTFMFVLFVVDANEIEQEGRFKANEQYIQLVESKNPSGIYISK